MLLVPFENYLDVDVGRGIVGELVDFSINNDRPERKMPAKTLIEVSPYDFADFLFHIRSNQIIRPPTRSTTYYQIPSGDASVLRNPSGRGRRPA